MAIESLKFCFSYQELREHMQKRALYHDGRATEKTALLPGLLQASEVQSRGSTAARNNYNMQANPAQEMEKDILRHTNKARNLRFLAEHLIGQDYYLDPHNMRTLELLDSED